MCSESGRPPSKSKVFRVYSYTENSFTTLLYDASMLSNSAMPSISINRDQIYQFSYFLYLQSYYTPNYQYSSQVSRSTSVAPPTVRVSKLQYLYLN